MDGPARGARTRGYARTRGSAPKAETFSSARLAPVAVWWALSILSSVVAVTPSSLVLLAQPAEAAVVRLPGGEPIRTTVDVGIGGRFVLGAWTPVVVHLENATARTLQAEVRLAVWRGSSLRGGGAVTTYVRAATVSPGARRDVSFVVPIHQIVRPLEVWCATGSWSWKAASVDLRHAASERLLLCRLDTPSAVPDTALAMDGIAVVEIDGFGMAELPRERFLALCDWVAFGGTLLAHWSSRDIAAAVAGRLGAASDPVPGETTPARVHSAGTGGGLPVFTRVDAGLGEVVVLDPTCRESVLGRPGATVDDLQAQGLVTRTPTGAQLFPPGGSQRALALLGSLPFCYLWDGGIAVGLAAYALLVVAICLLADRAWAVRRGRAMEALRGPRAAWALFVAAATGSACFWLAGAARVPSDTTFVSRLQVYDIVPGCGTAWLRDFTSSVSLVPRVADAVAPHADPDGIRPLEPHPLAPPNSTDDLIVLSPTVKAIVRLDVQAFRGYEVRALVHSPLEVRARPIPGGAEISIVNRSSVGVRNCQLFVGSSSRVVGEVGPGRSARVVVTYGDVSAAMPNDLLENPGSPPAGLAMAGSYREGALLDAAYQNLTGLPVVVVRPAMSMMDHVAESRLLRVRVVPGPVPVPDTRHLAYLVGELSPPLRPPLRVGIARNTVAASIFRVSLPIRSLLAARVLGDSRAQELDAGAPGGKPRGDEGK